MSTAYISHPDFMKHEMGRHHPECPERIAAIEDQLIQSRLDAHLKRIDPPLASEADITRVHSEDHLAFVKSKAPSSGYSMIDGDTIMNPATWTVSLRAAGAAIAAVDAVMQGEVNNAFCAIRPPGHHAEPHRSMGFCVFNNVAIATRYAIETYGLDRVAVIDFDVHHGNGTEAAFINDPHVLMCSFFQHPFYPYSGLDGGDNMVNVPLPASTNGKVVREMISQTWIPRLHEFKPQLIIISAGFDAHREDDLGQMGLVEDDYVWMTKQLMEIANQYCEGKIVSCLEGGYNLSALGRSVAAHLKTLAEI
ncbi:MAG: histone deacetylase family protein [Burkholderiaceae bacterium]|jgi:acetoin utilization deacetylase AcuC-like enzyme|uniref:histone deacetylase family protein n=1 Tax=unclassified Polynucleobacter TaxID=2640945 RepID=UPI001BFE7B8C|nr:MULTISPECIES: histone deacetylase family protein [unclassified Polynucleobacter]MBU3726203.1 histone deacetylase family protein [Polynucleobacter sp.]MBU6321822.1 histone deacetylase family protein [Burkholderiales bacterium]NBO84856.1 histone deacetylase family protein [Burkholderiaceae bacterium]NBO86770.1 histone deacetylase family protein [Burkholderiaceae bacterium]NBP96537.1 histone deacetylase family protein [Burkholderiaceae bacterium]